MVPRSGHLLRQSARRILDLLVRYLLVLFINPVPIPFALWREVKFLGKSRKVFVDEANPMFLGNVEDIVGRTVHLHSVKLFRSFDVSKHFDGVLDWQITNAFKKVEVFDGDFEADFGERARADEGKPRGRSW